MNFVDELCWPVCANTKFLTADVLMIIFPRSHATIFRSLKEWCSYYRLIYSARHLPIERGLSSASQLLLLGFSFLFSLPRTRHNVLFTDMGLCQSLLLTDEEKKAFVTSRSIDFTLKEDADTGKTVMKLLLLGTVSNSCPLTFCSC